MKTNGPASSLEQRAVRAERCKAQLAADAVIALAQSEVAGDVEYYWQLIRDEALKHVPLKPKEVRQLDAMTVGEVENFSRSFMPFGQHEGKQIRDVPLAYLDWFVGETEKDDFKVNLRRYISSDLVRGQLQEQIPLDEDI